MSGRAASGSGVLFWPIISLLVGLGVPLEAATVDVSLRDSQQGAGLQGMVFVFEPVSATIDDPPAVILSDARRLRALRWVPPTGQTRLQLPEGIYVFDVVAGGHDPLRTYFRVRDDLAVTFWMDLRQGPRVGFGEGALSDEPTLELSFPSDGDVTLQLPLMVWDPPDAIRVGTDCQGTTSCKSVFVLSLETYVQRGLDDEWFRPNWNPHAYQAGAIAYRGFAAGRFYDPRDKDRYDLTDNTWDQQYDEDDRGDPQERAARATAGILLQKHGAIAVAKHSSENNAWVPDDDRKIHCLNQDLSCLNGSAGSPNYGWPCVSDPWCKAAGSDVTDFFCYGHGEGMCQNGTNRWATDGLGNQGQPGRGKVWNWIVDHYFNDNGRGYANRNAFMTSPIEMTSVQPSPRRVRPDGAVDITARLTNHAQFTLDRVVVTASLYSPSTGKHRPLAGRRQRSSTVLPGRDRSLSRSFTVEPGTPTGTYDLVVGLWLDADEDEAIVAPPRGFEGRYDQPLLSQTLEGAIEILSEEVPRSGPWIWYRFEPADVLGRIVVNRGARPLLTGRIAGGFGLSPGALGESVSMDGSTTYVEVNRSEPLAFQNGLEVEAWFLRAANADEDAIVSKWSGAQDQWLLTLYADGNGLLVFTVRLQDGRYVSAEYAIPTTSYLGTWVHVAGRFDRSDGLRLFWNGQQVAHRPTFGQGMASGRRPIRVGDAGPGASWSRFRGRIDEVRIGPLRRSDWIDLSYSYSFGGLSGTATVLLGETFTIWDQPGGCGPAFRDTAQCQTDGLRRTRAFNHDCLSEDGPGTFGPWVSTGCSRAEEFGYVVECCVLP